MLQTTLNLTTHGNDVISGYVGTTRLTVRDLTFARPHLTTTQGQLVAADESSFTIRVQDGFPQVSELLIDRVPRLDPEQGLFVRRFRTGFADGPHLVTDDTCTLPNVCPWPNVANVQVRSTHCCKRVPLAVCCCKRADAFDLLPQAYFISRALHAALAFQMHCCRRLCSWSDPE
jgi:hypothetical protein